MELRHRPDQESIVYKLGAHREVNASLCVEGLGATRPDDCIMFQGCECTYGHPLYRDSHDAHPFEAVDDREVNVVMVCPEMKSVCLEHLQIVEVGKNVSWYVPSFPVRRLS